MPKYTIAVFREINSRCHYLLVMAIFMSVSQLHAEEVFDWQYCVKYARAKNPDLVSAREKILQADAQKRIVGSALWPQLNSNATPWETSASGLKANANDTYQYGMTASQLLFDGFKTINSTRSEGEKIRAAAYNYDVTSSNVRLNLRTAYIELMRAQEFILIAGEIRDIRKQDMELINMRYKAGREHRGALMTADANYAQAEKDVVQAYRNIELAQRRLTKALGESKLIRMKVAGGFLVKDPVHERPAFEPMAESIPFLEEIMARKEAARYSLKAAKAGFFPQVFANASGSETGVHPMPDVSSWMAGLSVSWPIFQGGLRIADVDKAKAALAQLRADEKSGRDGVILTLEDTWTKLQNAMENEKIQEMFLEANAERSKISKAEYSIGLVSFDNWIIIEDNLVRSKQAVLDAKAAVLIAEANWIQAKGGTLETEGK
jgi:outer membrane protein TolC